MNAFDIVRDTVFSVKQLMAKFDVSRRTVENWQTQGLETFKMGRRVYTTAQALQRFARVGPIDIQTDNAEVERQLEAIGV